MDSPQPVNQMIVLAHPDPGSFCAGIASRWQARARKHRQFCVLRDLNRDGFDPVLKATEQPGKAGYSPLAENVEECGRLSQLDVLTFVYPVWLGSPPAILKGYMERVVGCGVAFGSSKMQLKPLSNVRLVQIATSASSEPWLAEKGVRGALHTIYDQYIADIFGAKRVHRLHLASVGEGMKESHAAMLLAKVDELADRVCAEANADRWERAQASSRHEPM